MERENGCYTKQAIVPNNSLGKRKICDDHVLLHKDEEKQES